MNTQEQIIEAIETGNTIKLFEIIKMGVDLKNCQINGNSLIYFATHYNQRRCAEILLEAGVNPDTPNKNGITPLMHAAYLNYMDMVQMLVARNVNLNASDSNFGYTALIESVRAGNEEVAEILVKGGADPNFRDNNGWTALHHAVYKGIVNIVELLIGAGANVDTKSNNGETAYTLATHFFNDDNLVEQSNVEECLRLLKIAGASS
ncbi:hypothetical protein EN829_039785 [Mesorhizobium sp. M00.F.Ca.ET.186.01.1.1]|nr:hypothetical protein EN829_039785 [Mesorhizobium sp. M00.F.Ca.ET.186.01.1.1]